jgi:glucose/arabinose dehydrogenase
MTMKYNCIVIAVLIVLLVIFHVTASAEPAALSYHEQSITINNKTVEVRLPRGYRLELLTSVPDAPRLITFADNGDMFLGSRSDRVYRLAPPYTEAEVLLELDDYPHSVAFRENEILIAQTGGLYHAPYRPGQKSIEPDAVKLLVRLPGGFGHSSRTVQIGPDKRVYVSLGISGNCSDEYLEDSYVFNRRRGGVFVLDETDSQPALKAFATGLRNPVGFDWHPQTAVMYASNNGPDHQGFELPPESFAKLLPGSFHGMPWFQFNGEKIERDFCIRSQPPRPVSEVIPPVVTFPARNAPMGVTFIKPGEFIPAVVNDAVVALKGSWGTNPSGGAFGDPASRRQPKLVLVRFEEGEAVRVDDLLTGFQLEDGSRWARPVGVAFDKKGNLYFSSDSGTSGLYRLTKVK